MNKNTLIEITDILYEHGELSTDVLEAFDSLIQEREWEDDMDDVFAERLIDDEVTIVDVRSSEECVEVETVHYSGLVPLDRDDRTGDLWFAPEHVGDWIHKPTDWEFEAEFPDDRGAWNDIENEIREINKRRGEKPAGYYHWANSRGI